MKQIGSGVLRKSGGAYQVRQLYQDDIPSLITLQHKAIEVLDNPDTLQALSTEEFEYILRGNGLIVGAFSEGLLIGFRALLVPKVDEEHLGLVLGLENKLETIIYQEISVVHPIYRGNQLQQKLAYLIMEVLQEKEHPYQYVCATVAPHNIASLKDKFNQGMQIGALIEIYNGKLRYVFVKKIGEVEEQPWEEVKRVPTFETSLQKKLIDEGWHGFGLVQDDDSFSVKYGRMHPY